MTIVLKQGSVEHKQTFPVSADVETAIRSVAALYSGAFYVYALVDGEVVGCLVVE